MGHNYWEKMIVRNRKQNHKLVGRISLVAKAADLKEQLPSTWATLHSVLCNSDLKGKLFSVALKSSCLKYSQAGKK